MRDILKNPQVSNLKNLNSDVYVMLIDTKNGLYKSLTETLIL